MNIIQLIKNSLSALKPGLGNLSIILAFGITCLLGLSGCALIPAKQVHTLPANFSIKVTDPDLRDLTNIMTHIELEASGTFMEGTYQLGKAEITLPAKTNFKLVLSLPTTNPAVLSTKDAEGFLWTSQPITINGVPVPQKILLTQQRVSGEIDLGRSLGAWVFNVLQMETDGDDFKKIVDQVKVEQAKLYLRKGSEMALAGKKLQVGPDSTVTIRDLFIDKKFEYEGDCFISTNFGRGCKWLGEKVDCTFEGGGAALTLKINKVGKRLILTKKSGSEKQKMTMTSCNFRFGKNKRSSTSSAVCYVNVKELKWQHDAGQRGANLHFVGNMNFNRTNLNLKTDIHQTLAYFPQTVPGLLKVDINKNVRETHFNTTGNAIASSGRISVAKKSSKLVLHLGRTVLGPVDYDRHGALHFKLNNGIAQFKQLEWTGKKNKFTLVAAGDSILTVPDDMLIDKSAGAKTTNLDLPLTLKMGSARLRGARETIALTDLNGKFMVNVGKNIRLLSDLDFQLPRCSLFEGYDADISVRGLELTMVNGSSKLHLKNCTVMIPEASISETITKKVPSSFSFDMNKTLMEQERWRYRNAVATHAQVENLQINEIIARPDNTLVFSAQGDVKVDGTVEKGGIKAMFGTGGDNWEIKPWSISGHVSGTGTARYSFEKQKNKTAIKYDLAMKLPVPEDVEVDWSQVADGVFEHVEKKAIFRKLQNVEVPISKSGYVRLFKDGTNAMMRDLDITAIEVKPSGKGTRISFAARSTM